MSESDTLTVKEKFLQRHAQDERSVVMIYLVSGIKLEGRILEFDKENVLLTYTEKKVSQQPEKSQLIFINAIASVVPK